MDNNLPKLINVVSAQSRISNPDLILTRYFLELASFPPDSPMHIEIHDGKIVITYVPTITQ